MRENSWRHIPRVRKYEGVRRTSARGSLGSTRGDSSRVACSFADVVTNRGERRGRRRERRGERGGRKGADTKEETWWGSRVNASKRQRNYEKEQKKGREREIVSKRETEERGRELKREKESVYVFIRERKRERERELKE